MGCGYEFDSGSEEVPMEQFQPGKFYSCLFNCRLGTEAICPVSPIEMYRDFP